MLNLFDNVEEFTNEKASGVSYRSSLYVVNIVRFKGSTLPIIRISQCDTSPYIPKVTVHYMRNCGELKLSIQPVIESLLTPDQFREFQKVQSEVWQHVQEIELIISQWRGVKQPC